MEDDPEGKGRGVAVDLRWGSTRDQRYPARKKSGDRLEVVQKSRRKPLNRLQEGQGYRDDTGSEGQANPW